MTLRNSWVKYNLQETGYSQQTNDMLYHDEILRLEICLCYETFVVLGEMNGALRELERCAVRLKDKKTNDGQQT
ncbi:MAG: hypothetical protein ACK6DA_08095 [Candidatus Kapaibacterium sp.]|jgi:hypothetical protein